MRKEFLLSKPDLFVIFKFPKLGKIIISLVMLGGSLFKILQGRFTMEVAIDCLELIFILFLIFGSLFSLIYVKFKKVPYSIVIDEEKKIIGFVLCYTDSIQTKFFNEIEKITKNSRYLKFFTRNGRKYRWSINSKNQVLLESILLQNGLKIDRE